MSEKPKIQTVLFKKDIWSIEAAKKWLKDHGLKFSKVDDEYSPNYHRFRQVSPSSRAQYATKNLGNGVMLVFMQ